MRVVTNVRVVNLPSLCRSRSQLLQSVIPAALHLHSSLNYFFVNDQGGPTRSQAPKAVFHSDLPFPLLFTNVQNYKNNTHGVSRCQGALIFQKKAIFRKDSRENDPWSDGLGPTRSWGSPARGVLNGKGNNFAPARTLYGLTLARKGLTVRPVGTMMRAVTH